MTHLRFLERAPFHLRPASLAWVKMTFARLSERERLAQLLVPLAMDTSEPNLDRFAELGVGGLFRLPNQPLADLRRQTASIQARFSVPPLLCADLEYSEGFAIGGSEGTEFPNARAAAAAGLEGVARLARVAAAEGRAAGYNWTFSPVADLDINPNNPVVSTRSFGENAKFVTECVRCYVETLQRAGLAASVKHFPGDGAGDLDQHVASAVNPLSWAEWERSFGRVYRAAIRAGTLSIMAGHIAFPAWPGAGLLPATLSRALNIGLLRERLGFNGVIVSDASMMAGVTVHCPREHLVPAMVQAGCDVILFPTDPEVDLDYLLRACASGRLARERVDEAVLRVLALKANRGLHLARPAVQAVSETRQRQHRRWAELTARRAVTVVRDDARLLPISPRRHRRILLIQAQHRRSWFGPLPELKIGRLLEAQGFVVEPFRDESDFSSGRFDVAIHVVAEEAAIGKNALRIPWRDLLGDVPHLMARAWPEMPSVFISLGHPGHVREVTGCPVVINAYSPVPVMQAAVVDVLLGNVSKTKTSRRAGG